MSCSQANCLGLQKLLTSNITELISHKSGAEPQKGLCWTDFYGYAQTVPSVGGVRTADETPVCPVSR